MDRVWFGHLKLVVDEPRPQPAVGGGDGGDEAPPNAGWTIVEGAITHIAGERRVVEIAGWRSRRFIAVGGRTCQLAPDWICEPARKLGSYVLTQTMAARHELSMDSYDRLFPSQDQMPKGGLAT